jgi:hypothetical protein
MGEIDTYPPGLLTLLEVQRMTQKHDRENEDDANVGVINCDVFAASGN